MLGLSQMHQLRGRVGRGRERGYAYFLYPAEKPLTETAHDRLATIAQNSDLGAGMAVAMKDLEIRGAGNLLGAEQSGHIAGVGFDLYVRLVGEAVTAFKKRAAAREATATSRAEVRVELPIDAHVPHDYVARAAAAGRLPQDRRGRRRRGARRRAGGARRPLRRPPAPVTTCSRSPRSARSAGAHGITEVARQGELRFAPVDLPESAQMRLRRLYPGRQYKAASRTLSLPRPVEGQDGRGPVKMGAAPLRDLALLAWCEQLFTQLFPAPAAAATAAT